MEPLINILIRHKEGRDNEYNRCRSNVYNQTYTNFHMIISTELGHNSEWGHNTIISVPSSQHYNLHCNNLKKQVTEGWFFYLDDDDYLSSPTILEQLSHHLFEGALIVQFMRNKNGRMIKKPGDAMIANKIIKKGCIGGGCLILHHSFKGVADWDDQPAADYRWIKSVTDKIETRFIPLVLQIAGNGGLHGK
jgi:hypothetical protein